MKTRLSRPLALAGLAVLLGGCAMIQWRGSRGPAEAPSRPVPAVTEAAPARQRPPDPVRPGAAASALYWSDLGPDSVDVSSYPAQQRYNYSVYANACSRCHTLARSVNAPTASRAFWEMYVLGMRGVNRWRGNEPMSPDEVKAIVDFLEFDSKERKTGAKEDEFKAQTRRLKEAWTPLVQEKMRRLQESKQPSILIEQGGRP